jgi:hypothetical protein
MRFSFLFVSGLLLAFTGCFKTADQFDNKTTESAKIHSSVHDGVLYLNDAGKSYVLADDALDYRVIPSQDGRWLAVETLLLSNLQIVRVYQRGKSGRYHQLEDPLAGKLWDDLSKEENFMIDDVNYPRMRFLRWTNANSMVINMSGECGGRIIDRNVSFQLQLGNSDNFTNSK